MNNFIDDNDNTKDGVSNFEDTNQEEIQDDTEEYYDLGGFEEVQHDPKAMGTLLMVLGGFMCGVGILMRVLSKTI